MIAEIAAAVGTIRSEQRLNRFQQFAQAHRVISPLKGSFNWQGPRFNVAKGQFAFATTGPAIASSLDREMSPLMHSSLFVNGAGK
jgi:hypothetical protein